MEDANINPDAVKEDKLRLIKAAIPLVLMGILFAFPFYRVWFRWTGSEDYYSHGPLVIFISAFLVLRLRKKLTGEDPPDNSMIYVGAVGAAVFYWLFGALGIDKRWLFALLAAAGAGYMMWHLRNLKPEPWKKGLWILIPAVMLCVVAAVNEIVSLGWLFAMITVVGMSLYYLGRRITTIIAFPLLFLFTSVPLPEFVIEQVTLPMKKFAAATTVQILRSEPVFGITCVQTGVKIQFESDAMDAPKEVTVGAVCSGLRSLIALLSFGMLFAYVTPLSAWKRWTLFISTVPASFIANLVRILVLSLITNRWDAGVATGSGLWDALETTWMGSVVPNLRSSIGSEPIHDITGIMVFVIAFIGLFSLERFLTWLDAREKLKAAGAGEASNE